MPTDEGDTILAKTLMADLGEARVGLRQGISQIYVTTGPSVHVVPHARC